MLIETTTLPIELQQQILQVINSPAFSRKNQKSVTTQNALEYFANIPVSDEIADIEFDLPELENAEFANKPQSLYDIFANADPAVADIDFELPPRTISNRPIPFEDE